MVNKYEEKDSINGVVPINIDKISEKTSLWLK